MQSRSILRYDNEILVLILPNLSIILWICSILPIWYVWYDIYDMIFLIWCLIWYYWYDMFDIILIRQMVGPTPIIFLRFKILVHINILTIKYWWVNSIRFCVLGDMLRYLLNIRGHIGSKIRKIIHDIPYLNNIKLLKNI